MSFTTYDHRWHLKMVAPFFGIRDGPRSQSRTILCGWTM